jgi:hypothetical protein
LKLYHYLFLDYSPQIASEIVSKFNMELSLKNDKLFIDGVYKLARDMLNYVPKLTRDQFFQTSFAQPKALMAVDIIELVHQRLKTTQIGSISSSTSSLLSTGSHVLSSARTASSHSISDHSEGASNHNGYTHSPKPAAAAVNRQSSFNHYSSLQRQVSLKVCDFF